MHSPKAIQFYLKLRGGTSDEALSQRPQAGGAIVRALALAEAYDSAVAEDDIVVGRRPANNVRHSLVEQLLVLAIRFGRQRGSHFRDDVSLCHPDLKLVQVRRRSVHHRLASKQGNAQAGGCNPS